MSQASKATDELAGDLAGSLGSDLVKDGCEPASTGKEPDDLIFTVPGGSPACCRRSWGTPASPRPLTYTATLYPGQR